MSSGYWEFERRTITKAVSDLLAFMTNHAWLVVLMILLSVAGYIAVNRPVDINNAVLDGLVVGSAVLIFLIGIMLLFYIFKAPYSLWCEQKSEIQTLKKDAPALSKKWTLIDFLKYASANGWQLEGDSTNPLDLLDGLRQAGLDGTILFFGRRKDVFRNVSLREPLIPIPRAYWRMSEINLFSLFKFEKNRIVALGHNNTKTFTSKPGKEEDYLDIHLDSKRAKEWLSEEADRFVGRNKSLSRSKTH